MLEVKIIGADQVDLSDTYTTMPIQQLGLSLINIWLHCLILVGLLQKLSCGKDTCNLEQGGKTI